MPTTCAFNSDPIATPAANKVTLTGGGRPDRQPGRQEGVTGPRVLPPRLLGAATFPVTREAFYCQSSKCTPNPADHGFAAPAARRLRGRGARGAPGAWACVPAEVAGPLPPTRDGVGGSTGDMELPPRLHKCSWAGGDSVPPAPLPQVGNSPTASQGGPSAPGLVPGRGLGGRVTRAGAFHLQDTAWPLEQFSWPQPGQITTLGRAQRDNPGGGQSHRAPPSLGSGRVQPGRQVPASKLPSPPLSC